MWMAVFSERMLPEVMDGFGMCGRVASHHPGGGVGGDVPGEGQAVDGGDGWDLSSAWS
jgi:hypothetical protein